MTQWISLFFENFSLGMFLVAIVAILIHSLFRQYILQEVVFRWMSFFALGFTGIYVFILHVFFPQISAAGTGWAVSPFQFEVGMADLAIGVLGLLAFNASFGFRVATVIASFCFLWGDAIGHVRQMIIHHNFAPGNAGSWFWMDILIPLILLSSIRWIKKYNDKVVQRTV